MTAENSSNVTKRTANTTAASRHSWNERVPMFDRRTMNAAQAGVIATLC